MSKEEDAVAYLTGERLSVDDYPTLFFEIAVGPDVVIAREVVHLYAHIGELGNLSEEPSIALRHHVAVFVPEVEHVAEQVDGSGFRLDAVEESHQSALLHALMLYGE